MKKLCLLLILILALTFALLTSCTVTPDAGADNNGGVEGGEGGEEDNSVLITFIYGQKVMNEYVQIGSLPNPPELEDVDMGAYKIHFTCWDKEITPVTEETTYTALYELFPYSAKATFVMGDRVEVVEHDYNKKPNAPTDIPNYRGMTFVRWDKNVAASSEDVTYTAVYVDETLMDIDGMTRAFGCDLVKYSSKTTDNDNSNGAMVRNSSLFYMVWHEHLNPQGGALVERIVAHYTSIVTKDQAPMLDACCYWNYNPLTAGIALARNTPTIWEAIPADVKLRLETLMVAFVYLESYSTSDHNNFSTGPGLKGNYNKDWNPNYRLANVPTMVYATYFFGVGDTTAGADHVNTLIKNFDETVYDNLVNTFQRYGWRRALLTWTAEERTTTDGTNFTGGSSKQLLVYGGYAVGDDTSTSSDLLVQLGSGTGVANRDGNGKGRDYLYKGFTLYEGDKILRHLINYNYGGSMSTNTYEATSYKKVVSEHWYSGKLVAYIIDETSSPYEGMEGMMTEFASGNRSSTSYTNHDFILTTVTLCAARAMELYTTESDGTRSPLLDAEGNQKVLLDYTAASEAKFWLRIQVGNEDFIYKYLHGYQSYSTGSYGEKFDVGYESNNNSHDYRISKSVWRTYMMTWGSIEIAESFSQEAAE